MADEPVAGVTAPQPQVVGDLVVAGPAGAELAAEGAEPLHQPALDGAVDVLVGRLEREGVVGEEGRTLVDGAQHLLHLVAVQDPDAMQLLGVGAGTGQILAPQVAVEAGGDAQLPGGLVRAGLESTAPQPPRPGRAVVCAHDLTLLGGATLAVGATASAPPAPSVRVTPSGHGDARWTR